MQRLTWLSDYWTQPTSIGYSIHPTELYSLKQEPPAQFSEYQERIARAKVSCLLSHEVLEKGGECQQANDAKDANYQVWEEPVCYAPNSTGD